MSYIKDLRIKLSDLQLYEDGMTKEQMEEMLEVFYASLDESNNLNKSVPTSTYDSYQNGRSPRDNRYSESFNINSLHKENNYETLSYKIRLLRKIISNNKDFENHFKEYEKLLTLLNEKSTEEIDNNLTKNDLKPSSDESSMLDTRVEMLRKRFRYQRRLLIVQDFYKCKEIEERYLNDCNDDSS